MRFILFNAIVAGALIYLFSGADQPGADARQTVDDAMSRLAALSEQAVERVEELKMEDPGRADAAPAMESPAPRSDLPAPSKPALPQARPAAAPDPVAEPPRPAAPATRPPAQADPATRVAAALPAPAPVETAPAPLPEREVATVPTHRVPKPGDSGPVAAAPAKGPIEIAEPMMSSQDRRKELFSLAQEMEMMYATRVHE